MDIENDVKSVGVRGRLIVKLFPKSCLDMSKGQATFMLYGKRKKWRMPLRGQCALKLFMCYLKYWKQRRAHLLLRSFKQPLLTWEDGFFCTQSKKIYIQEAVQMQKFHLQKQIRGSWNKDFHTFVPNYTSSMAFKNIIIYNQSIFFMSS